MERHSDMEEGAVIHINVRQKEGIEDNPKTSSIPARVPLWLINRMTRLSCDYSMELRHDIHTHTHKAFYIHGLFAYLIFFFF